MRAAVVSVHGVRAGSLERLNDDEDYSFRFDEGWLGDPDRPTLGQIFLDRMPDEVRTSGLPCWFAHLLPQGPSRRLYQRWARLDPLDDDSFDLLVAMGMDLPGAVTLSAAEPRPDGVEYAAPRLRRPGIPAFALPGAQCKLSARPGQRGLVVPAEGEAGAVIAKFDDPSFPGLPRLEWATTEWARLSGVRVHTARLTRVDEFSNLPRELPLGDGSVFVAERFDRTPAGSVHAEDFGQLLDRPPGDPGQYTGSNEDLAKVLSALAPDDVRELVERLAFMVVCGNGDAHLKNWGVVYEDRRAPRLGPAYDLVATVARLPGDHLALSLSGTTDFGSVGASSFDAIARCAGGSVAEARRWVTDARDRALNAWREHGARTCPSRMWSGSGWRSTCVGCPCAAEPTQTFASRMASR